MTQKDLRELDVKIAETLGWQNIRWVKSDGTHHVNPFGVKPGAVPSPYTGYVQEFLVPEYSSDIKAAWELVEKLKTRDVYVDLHAPKGDKHWVFQINGANGAGADTAPLAICQAFLKHATSTSDHRTPAPPQS